MLTKDDICFHPVVEEEKKRLQESTIAWGTLATKTISPAIYTMAPTKFGKGQGSAREFEVHARAIEE